MARLKGSIYEGRSPVGQRTLADLRTVLRVAGFYAEKARTNEGTLRVYPHERFKYPLMNPEFWPGCDMGRWKANDPTLVCFVLSDGNPAIVKGFKGLRSTETCTFFPDNHQGAKYYSHGQFLIRVPFAGPALNQQVDFDALLPVLVEMHRRVTAIDF